MYIYKFTDWLLRLKKNSPYIGGFLAVLLVIASVNGASKNGNGNYFAAAPSEFTQTVEVAGTVKPAEEVDLAFEKTGRIVELNVDINDQVEPGDTLAKINSDDVDAQKQDALASVDSSKATYSQYAANIDAERARLRQLQADLAKEQSILEEIKRGARSEELDIAEAAVSNAEQSLTDAESNFDEIVKESETVLNNLYDQAPDIADESYIISNDVATRLTREMFDRPNSVNAQLDFQTGGNYDDQAEDERKNAIQSLMALEDLVNVLSMDSSQTELDTALNQSLDTLQAMKAMLRALNIALDNNLNLSDSTYNTYKSNTTEANTNINSAITNLNNLIQQISNQKANNSSNVTSAKINVTTAENELTTAQEELKLTQAGSTAEEIQTQEAIIAKVQADIAAQQANIRSAQANLASATARISQSEAQVARYDAEIDKTILTAPIAGQITSKEYSLGEIAQINDPIYRLISSTNYEIIADIPEIDISNISVGDKATVYLDAYGPRVTFDAVVTEIEPAERIIEGLSKYRTTLQFVEEDNRIKSGMTANLTILVAQKEGVISVPARSIIEREDQTYIRVRNIDKRYDKRAPSVLKRVILGSYSSDGRVEVLDGLRSNDVVLLPN